ncbi:hypothetical protein ALC57_16581 [Trachymyrmex cornetzi]|uniref:Uncharacterized protein n=1 Tax=Trachymyrmex cornetzi TaxID=471704 RepID=A0A151IV97_9HYME|nr:hypothetical protein ALC57_16581 [Trachymyrmex cornetzi]
MYSSRSSRNKDSSNTTICSIRLASRVGVKSNVVARKTITFDDYTLYLSEEIETRRQSCIRSKLYEVYTISELKIALSSYDDKRYVVPDSTEMLL